VERWAWIERNSTVVKNDIVVGPVLHAVGQ